MNPTGDRQSDGRGNGLRSTAIIALAASLALTISVVAQPQQDLALSGNEIERMVEALRDAAVEINNATDLDPLLERIGDARAVLLGEASHGTHEFYKWRTLISKRLIDEKDFSFIAVEADWNVGVRINRYVKDLPGAKESGRAVLKSLDRWPKWMWANEDILELIEWLREYNLERDEDQRIGFYGIDVYGYAESIEKAPRYLAKIDEELAATLEDAFDCYLPYADNVQHYVRAIAQQGVNCGDRIEEAVGAIRDDKVRLKEND